jgi:uncharacterized membrane protein
MAIGPIQLIVLGFANPDFKGEGLEELQKLRESDTIRVVDALAVVKDADGEVLAVEWSNLTSEEEVEMGAKIGALIGLGVAGEEGFVTGAELGAETAAKEGVDVFDDEMTWDVIEGIPANSAAVLLLIEHHWAVGLRDAVARAGGFRIAEGFISPVDLVRVGLLAAAEADAHQALAQGDES